MLNIDKVCHYRVRSMNVSLTPELEKFVSTKVESGRYNSASEVVREALRLLEEHYSALAARLAEFNKELGRRLPSIDPGQTVEPPQSPSRLHPNSHHLLKLT